MIYEPAASAVLERTPSRIRIQFSEHIEAKASSIAILAPDGTRAEAKDGAPDPTDPRVFSVGLRDAGEGLYTVSWQVVSQDDGHFTKGGFSFSVGKVAAANARQVEVERSSTTPQAAAIATELLGQAVLVGLLAGIALLWRRIPQRKISDIQYASFEHALSLSVISATILIATGTIAFLFLKTVDLQQSRAASFTEALQTFLTTVDGRFALYRAILGIAFAATFFATRKAILSKRRFSKGEAVLLLLIALMILARARVSHAAASHFMPTLSILVNAIHLLSKEFWIGGLIVLTFVFMPALSRLGRASTMAHTLTLLSKHASVALGATGVTGAYIVWLHLKSPAYAFTSEWGTRFVLLSLFAGVLAAMRLYNQIVVESSVVADSFEPQKGYRKDIAASWRYTIPTEMCAGVVVLFVTSQLIITTPPYPPETNALKKQSASHGANVSLSLHSFEQNQFLVAVSDEKTGVPLTVSDAVVSLQNVEKNVGPIVAETDMRFEGAFTFPRQSLSIPGRWTIDITARRPESYDAVASFQLDYPKDLDDHRVSADQRHFGAFEAVMASIALASVVLSIALYRFSARLNKRCADIDPRRGLSGSGFKIGRSLAAGVSTGLFFTLLVWASYDSFVKTEFQRLCESNNGVWTQSTPMRAGAVLSSDTIIGCTVEAGAYHFVDLREYAYFTHPQSPEHHHH